MSKIGIFYSTTSGKTQRIAQLMQEKIGITNCCIHNILEFSEDKIPAYSIYIFGSPTYGNGELHYPWIQFLDTLKDIPKKTYVGLFTLGDQKYHSNTFAGALFHFHKKLSEFDLNFIGKWPSSDYKFKSSPSLDEEKFFYGLVLDQVNQRNLSSLRIEKWVDQLLIEYKSLEP